MDVIYQALSFVFTLLEVLLIFNLLILVHELGHFLAAKWRGMYIEAFGIWFGKPLWQKKINGVNYSLGSIPAGGFVKLPQMAPMEAMEGETEVKLEDLKPVSVMDKIIVAFAGPLFSFGLAFLFAVLVWQVGRPMSESEKTTVVGYVTSDSPAEKAGFQVGDKILEIDGHPVNRWGGMGEDSIVWRIVRSEGSTVEVKVLRNGNEVTLNPEPRVPEKAHWWNRAGLRQIGIVPQCTPVIGKVEKGSAADQAGLKVNDIILDINGQKLYDPEGIFEYMKNHTGESYTFHVRRDGTILPIPFKTAGVTVKSITNDPYSPAQLAHLKVGDLVTGIDDLKMPVSIALTDYIRSHGEKTVTLKVNRDGNEISVPIKPQIPEHAPEGLNKPMIGLTWEDKTGIEFDGMGVPGDPSKPLPVEQIKTSMMMIVNTINAVASPKSSIGVQQMGGPVMMMRAYFAMLSEKDGWRMALWFSVILNVNLALLNLLPIPVLDGGHIMLAIIEGIRRKPINLKVLEIVQTACAVVIIGFMLFIFFFDVQDLPFFGDKSPAIKFRPPTTDTQR